MLSEVRLLNFLRSYINGFAFRACLSDLLCSTFSFLWSRSSCTGAENRAIGLLEKPSILGSHERRAVLKSLSIYICIYKCIYICEPYSSSAPIFQHVQCTLSVAHSGTFLKISCHKSFWLYIVILKYFEKVRSQVALQAIVRISISISFGPLWGWADLLPPQQQHKQTSRMTWLERAYF